MLNQHDISPVLNNAPSVTYTAGVTSLVFWGLHLSDIAVMLSAFASVCGVGLQFYVALHRIRRLERAAEANIIVTSAMAQGTRALDVKVETKKDQQNGS